MNTNLNEYQIANILGPILDAEDTGGWKSEVLTALANRADEINLGFFCSNDQRRFVRVVRGLEEISADESQVLAFNISSAGERTAKRREDEAQEADKDKRIVDLKEGISALKAETKRCRDNHATTKGNLCIANERIAELEEHASSAYERGREDESSVAKQTICDLKVENEHLKGDLRVANQRLKPTASKAIEAQRVARSSKRSRAIEAKRIADESYARGRADAGWFGAPPTPKETMIEIRDRVNQDVEAITDLKRENAELEKTIDHLENATIHDLRKELEQQGSSLRDAYIQARAYDQDITDLKAANTTLMMRADYSAVECDKLKSELRRLAELRSKHERTHATMRGNLRVANERLAMLEPTATARAVEAQAIVNQNQRDLEHAQKIEELLHQVAGAEEHASQAAQRHSESLEYWRTTFLERNRQIDDLKKTIVDKESKLKQAAKDFIAEQEAFASREESIEFQGRCEALLEAAQWFMQQDKPIIEMWRLEDIAKVLRGMAEEIK